MRRLLVALFLLIPSLGWAQYVAPDDRYKGYPSELVQWMSAPPTAEQLAACLAGEYYEPADDSIAKYASRVKIADYRVTQVAECRWTLTAHSDPVLRWRLALRPPGTKIALDAQGRDLFDFGTANGVVCKNPSPYGWPVSSSPPAVIVPPVPLRVQIEEGKYTPKYEEPEVTPVVIPVIEKKKSRCRGLCAALIVGGICAIGQVANGGVCGIKFGGEDIPPVVIQPPPIAPPPPNLTPVKPPD